MTDVRFASRLLRGIAAGAIFVGLTVASPAVLAQTTPPATPPTAEPATPPAAPPAAPTVGPDGLPVPAAAGTPPAAPAVGPDGLPIAATPPAPPPMQPVLGPDGQPIIGPDGQPVMEPAPVAAAPGVVQIAVSPWGHVEIDGVPAGTTPPLTRLTLAAGSHTITVRNEDFPPFTTTVEVTADKPVTVRHRFGS